MRVRIHNPGPELVLEHWARTRSVILRNQCIFCRQPELTISFHSCQEINHTIVSCDSVTDIEDNKCKWKKVDVHAWKRLTEITSGISMPSSCRERMHWDAHVIDPKPVIWAKCAQNWTSAWAVWGLEDVRRVAEGPSHLSSCSRWLGKSWEQGSRFVCCSLSTPPSSDFWICGGLFVFTPPRGEPAFEMRRSIAGLYPRNDLKITEV